MSRLILSVDKNMLNGIKISESLARRIENACLKTSLLQIYSNWSELANDGLNSTRSNYIKGLVITGGQGNRSTASISLRGVLNNMIESGCPSFDMKSPGFANSSKIKFNAKGGWFLTIPIQQKNNVSVLMNSMLPSEIFALITTEVVSETNSITESSAFTDRKQILENKGSSKIPRSSVINNINSLFESYKGKSQINFSNPTVSKSGQVQFRRVGQNSKPDSWIHPGLTAKNFGDKAFEKFQATQQTTVMENTVVNILKETGII